MDATLNDLTRLLKLSRQSFDIRSKIRRQPSFKPIVILEDLSWDEFARLNLNLPYLSGVEPLVGQKRIYPHAQSVAHLVGFVAQKPAKTCSGLMILSAIMAAAALSAILSAICAARRGCAMSR